MLSGILFTTEEMMPVGKNSGAVLWRRRRPENLIQKEKNLSQLPVSHPKNSDIKRRLNVEAMRLWSLTHLLLQKNWQENIGSPHKINCSQDPNYLFLVPPNPLVVLILPPPDEPPPPEPHLVPELPTPLSSSSW